MGLFDIFSNSNAEDAANAKIAGLNAGYNQASGLYGQGRDAITNYYGQAQQPFQDILSTLTTGPGASGYNAYADASGASGAAGLARARDLFTQTPGYQEGLDLSLNANDRRAASRGMLGSGNTVADTTKLATDYASQHYNDYLKGLQPYMATPTQATSAAAGNAGVLTGEGGALNASYGNQGNLAYQTQVGAGNATAAADLNNYNVSNNMWGALMGGANLLTGSLGGGLFSGFGGGSGAAVGGADPMALAAFA